MTTIGREPGRLLLATLLALTVSSGLVDAVSDLGLGHVFMALGGFAGASIFLHSGASATLLIGSAVVLVAGAAFWAAQESRRLDERTA
jgi:hypothetical protein